MKRATGNGGIFFKSDDPKNLYAWYEKHLGIKASADGTGATFAWRDAQRPETKGQVQPIPVKPRGKLCESPEERAHNPRFTGLRWM
jgi:hypothetical protein